MSSFSFDSSSPTPFPEPQQEARLPTRRDEPSPDPPPRHKRYRSYAKRSRRRRFARLSLRIVVSFLVVVCVLWFGTAAWLRHAMHTSLPQIDGSVRVPGLAESVTVTRDDHGIPSITAASLDDLLYAQGYVAAQDRLWQMEAARRHAAGELAEILGSGLIAHDRTQRTLQLRAAAERSVSVLPPDQLHQLQVYANGVNAFLAQHADTLPVEFHLLHFKPAPWTPRDSLLIALAMFQDLSTEYPSKLQRETLSAHLPAQLVADLYPVGSWRDHPPGQVAPDLVTPRPEIEQIPLDETQSKLALPNRQPQRTVSADDLLAAQAASFQLHCEGCRAGSNNWAVSGSRSASGKPLLSNDMHLALNIPGIWYEAALHTTDGSLDVAGMTLPGVPFVVVGRNQHVAWGFTNLGGDTQEIYIEHTRGAGATLEYERADGSWAPVEHHTEFIRVRGSRNITLDVLSTSHAVGSASISTPIISALYPSETRTLALAWTAYDPASVTSPFAKVNMAVDGASVVGALSNWGGPTQNLVYADDLGHIGYHAIGLIPIRGPAVHHPLAAPAPGPTGPLPSDEDSDDGQDDTASATLSPHLVLAAYRPAARRLRRAARSEAKPTSKSSRRAAKPAKAKSAPPEAPIPPLPAVPDYTVGSPIAPGPVDALDPAAQWSGYIPFAELPAVADPAAGVIATANSRITPDGYPYAVSLNWAAPYRVERITHVLASGSGFTPADMLRLQMDIHSEFDLTLAQRLVYALDHAPADAPDSKRLHAAADLLRHWNGNMDADSAAASIIAAVRTELWSALLLPQIAAHDHAVGANQASPEAIAKLYTWGESGYALEQILQHQPKRWLPPGVADWNTFLAQVTARALKHAPSDLAAGNYAHGHPVEINHPVFSMSPLFRWLLGVPVSSGPRFVGGDTFTVKATSLNHGASERFTADLAGANTAIANLPAGQSGNPSSPWYLDQLPLWLNGETLPLPLHNTPARHTLTLTP